MAENLDGIRPTQRGTGKRVPPCAHRRRGVFDRGRRHGRQILGEERKERSEGEFENRDAERECDSKPFVMGDIAIIMDQQRFTVPVVTGEA